MKGSIASCLKETIITNFDKSKWEEILITSGHSKNMSILASSNIDDEIILKIVQNTCKILKLSLEELADYFGDYWMNNYAVKIYKPYYGTISTAKEFFLKLNEIHFRVTKNIPNAHPPKFEYEWKNKNTLIMTYISQRGLIDFVIGLAKGIGNYFKESIFIRKISSTKIEISF